ncbi:undecaprenyldiphospho-muramoylpentapeptide beta-N-acetylglucosaminyltransferase [Candidatus Pantoea carbekii]|uniref:UDP-N-acetylglucosamine--N-acetylmuramyl-(pentapeptide) pyrophosphoryl-undecaprenol N-acetylglucosamine transferase n=1 Tax=Candidatus Pantoea carbekii TaxID=1235990 RepID=U3U2S5_9GAMM|nr:undecaprenyldiphospho-muramoylpentapeptide beta-N-acetylglucosaminyltransferase [Candidatus Pantoea carbekii]AKC31929.1 UDP-N-acetylglucosamine-N- acetylmuramyl(pentapeptide) pyrophosphoryl-undecaprenol Nacetylglucosamine transferase [Candidatus Pantoea carbekii]BAO00446.1 undecaprenyldiphospho-muramoylpentapeptide beta-N-acetylglucosaminyltransferase [Candidatus Pantoea carbekii]
MIKKRLMVMAGGTGGHIFPALVIAQHLMKQGWQICWIGTANHMEAHLVPQQGINIEFICINSLRGKSITTHILAPMNILNAWRQAYNIIKKWKPNVALGTGGYVSGPSGLAAWSYNVPIVLHEQNSVPGFTNRWLAKIADSVIQGFPGAFPDADVVGNPIRANILALPLPAERLSGRTGPMRILVLGGSQGSHILNQTMPLVAKELGHNAVLWHQTGKNSKKIVQQAYQIIGQHQHKITEFIDDIAEAYAWTDIVICRSGALTVSEIAAVGLPAIFVPFRHKDNQQYLNALPLERAGAAKIFQQTHFNAATIVTTLCKWNRTVLLTMAEKARKIAMLDSTDKIVEVIKRIAK